VKFNVASQAIPMKLVFVIKRGQTRSALGLGDHQTSLKPAEIIQLYSHRWQIEYYFEVAKQYLQFDQTQI
jgi:Transposase DDE domain.